MRTSRGLPAGTCEKVTLTSASWCTALGKDTS